MKNMDVGTANPIAVSPSVSATASRLERMLLLSLITAAVALYFIWTRYCRFHNDEPQHLHVVWGWATGRMQYRDVFDNHMPLFHILFAPIYLLFGERPDILVWMRLTMFPFFAAAVWFAYRLGRSLYTPRIGLWAAAFVALFPPVFLLTVQFRADNPWMFFWLAAVCLLLSPNPTTMKRFCAGLLLGAAIGTSLKSVIMLAALAGASLMFLLIARREMTASDIRRYFLRAIPVAAGVPIIPIAIAAYFILRGAWDPFIYCVVQHNIVPGGHTLVPAMKFFLLLPGGLIAIFVAASYLYRHRQPQAPPQRLLLILIIALYCLLIFAIWPVITGQDFLPIFPLLLVPLMALALYLPSALKGLIRRDVGRAARAIPILIIILEVFSLGIMTPVRDRTSGSIAMLADLIHLTNPDDSVIDRKGEFIFRPRGCRYVFETLTRERLHRGLLKDDIPEQLIASRTCVSINVPHHMTRRAIEFMRANYISVGTLAVAGQYLHPDSARPDKPISFTIQIPAAYYLITPKGPAAGTLDGRPCHDAVELKPGSHTYQPAPGETRVALVWAQAIDRDFRPTWEESER